LFDRYFSKWADNVKKTEALTDCWTPPAHRPASIPEDSPSSTQNHGIRRTPVGNYDRVEKYGGENRVQSPWPVLASASPYF